jgi:hypothetical protein
VALKVSLWGVLSSRVGTSAAVKRRTFIVMLVVELALGLVIYPVMQQLCDLSSRCVFIL